MAKKSIGEFIAALRRANGMTQQDVADRLNVSNKAVSRWERDECAPDISLIPAIAEIFGITCDELLRGERIAGINAEELTEKRGQKALKQVNNLINRTLSDFKMMIYGAIAVATVGLVCMFGISYGFYRPVLGFFVMMLFEVAAIAASAIAVGKARDTRRDNELFEAADAKLISYFDTALAKMSFSAFFTVLSSIVISLPFIIVNDEYHVNSVLTLSSYFTLFCGALVMILLFIWLKVRPIYVNYMTTGRLLYSDKVSPTRKMTLIQLSCTVCAGVLFVIAPYFLYHITNEEFETVYTAIIVIGMILLAANAISFTVFTVKQKNERRAFIFTGMRNLLFIPAAITVSEMHFVSWTHEGYNEFEPTSWVRYDHWLIEYLWYAIIYAALVYLVFALIDAVFKKKKT